MKTALSEFIFNIRTHVGASGYILKDLSHSQYQLGIKSRSRSYIYWFNVSLLHGLMFDHTYCVSSGKSAKGTTALLKALNVCYKRTKIDFTKVAFTTLNSTVNLITNN